MLDERQLTDSQGQALLDSDGKKIGTIDELYLDQGTGRPEWALVNTGFFGTRSSFVPLSRASADAEGLRVPYTKDEVKDAPSVEADGELSAQEEAELYRHYGLDYGWDGAADQSRDADGPVGNDLSGPETDDAVTRSEEELDVGTTRREAGRVRLRKYVDTEQVTETVPVEHEEVRIEREPVSEANADAALDGPAISEEEHEVTLHEERPVVEKRAVPKERIRLDKEVVTEEEQVADEVRKERVEIDDDARR